MKHPNDENFTRRKRRLKLQTNALGPLVFLTCIPWAKLGWFGLVVQITGLLGLALLVASFFFWRGE